MPTVNGSRVATPSEPKIRSPKIGGEAGPRQKTKANSRNASFVETDLYEPVKALLEGQGYEVGDVLDSDIRRAQRRAACLSRPPKR